MTKIAIASLFVLAGCPASNPPPQYAQTPPGPPQGGSMQTQDLGAPAGAEEVPIDPVKDMPDGSLSTDATLAIGIEATVMIDARADIFSSGMKAPDEGRGGKLPAALTLAPGGGVVVFPRVVGKAGCMAEAVFGSDGGDCAGGNTDLTSTESYAGIVAHDRTLFLVGVFTGPKPPAKAPARLDFSPDKQGIAFARLEPQLGQVFFIGDGKTGTGSGSEQVFVVPAGATMLHLGYADGFSFQGTPGAYDDNKGGLRAAVVQRAP